MNEKNQGVYYILNNHHKKIVRHLSKLGIPKDNIFLIAWEPKIVLPKMHSDSLSKWYGKIFSPSPIWFKNLKNVCHFNWPQGVTEDINPSNNFSSRKDLVLLMQANKFSIVKGENYSLRRELISKCNQFIDVYGEGWNKGFFYDLQKLLRSIKSAPAELKNLQSATRKIGLKVLNYRGIAIQKRGILSDYKYNLVIENSSDYVSEKLFDSILSGCLTFYFGPDLRLFGLNVPSLIILEGNLDEMYNRIIEVQQLPVETKQRIAQEQFKELSSQMQRWENNEVFKKLAHDIFTEVSYNSQI